MNRHCQHYKWLWCLWSRSSWKDHSFDWQPSSWLSSRCLVRGQVLKCFWQLNHVIFIVFRLIDFPCACKVTSITSDSSWPYGPWPARLLLPWDSPGKNTGVGYHFLLQEIFQTQESNHITVSCVGRRVFLPLVPSGGEGNGTPLQYSCLETPMERGAW